MSEKTRGYDHGISFFINGLRYRADESKMEYTEGVMYERDEYGEVILGDNNQPIPVLDPETLEPMNEKTGLRITGDTINYTYTCYAYEQDECYFIVKVNDSLTLIDTPGLLNEGNIIDYIEIALLLRLEI